MQTLIGRLTADAVIKTTKNEKQVVNFSIALNHYYKVNGEGREETTYVYCSFWRYTSIAERLKKGALVEITGNISLYAYTDAQGNPKASLNFHTNEIKVHAQRVEANAPQPQSGKKNERKSSGKNTRKNQSEQVPASAEITEPIDDLPF